MLLPVRLALLAAFVIAPAAALPAQVEPAPPPLRKIAEYKMARARLGAAAVALGNHLYIFGGSGGRESIYQAERIDLATGETELLPHRFLSRRFHNVAEHDGKIYLIGGQTFDRVDRPLETRVEVFDPAADTVTVLGENSDPRRLAGVVKLGHELWIIGGSRWRSSGVFTHTNEVLIFDLVQHTWKKGPPMPTPRMASGAVLVGQFVLVPGGYATRSKQKAVEMFVPQENVWKRLPELGEAVAGHSAAVLGKWLFLFGDLDDRGRVLAYDLTTRKTNVIKTNFTETRFSTALTVGDRIYVIGGEAFDAGFAGGQGVLRDNRNFARADGTERELVQVFELQN